MNNKKMVVFKYNVNLNLKESHTFIIDESYEIDEEDEMYELYEDLENKFGEPIIEVEDEDLIWIELDDMNIIN